MELYEIVLADFAVTLIAWSTETVQQGRAVLSLFPSMEIGRTVLVTQIAVKGVWLKPTAIGVEELLEFTALAALVTVKGVEAVKILALEPEYTLIINGRECVQFLALFPYTSHELAVINCADEFQVYVDGIQCER